MQLSFPAAADSILTSNVFTYLYNHCRHYQMYEIRVRRTCPLYHLDKIACILQ